LHRLQFGSGDGPVVETLRHNEPRRVDAIGAECRWPAFCRAAAEAGFGSCLVLPLRTDRQPAGAVALYGDEPDVFRGAAHDVALLVAAQGGTAVHNAALYRTCRRMVDNLHAGLESRAVIEQAKGILHAELGVSPAEAFHLLSRYSQNTNQRVRKVSAGLVQGRIAAAEFRSLVKKT
jgi:GAF domain-containing protein